MADMSLDELLSSSIKSAAEPAASKGVADAIRTRVAAGDTGTSVAGSTAPGWGGSASGVLTIVAPIALIVVAGVVGGALGAGGVFGAPLTPASGDVPAYLTTEQVATAYVCPGGPEIGQVAAGTRVLAVARDADGAFIGVRNPNDLATTWWFSTSDVALDDGGVDPASLPVIGCPEVTVTVVTPTPTPEPTQDPQPDPTQPPGTTDTTPPSVKLGNWSQSDVYGTGSAPYCPEYSDIVVAAADNVGVTSVTATQSHPGSSIAQVSANGGNYTFRFTGGVYFHPSPNIQVTVTFTAKDAAGNTTNTAKTINLNNTCLI